MSKSSNKEFATALYSVTKNLSGAELDQALNNFVILLFNSRKLKQAGAIITEFEKYAKKEQGIVSIEITSAHALDTETVSHIKKVFGNQVEATQKINSTILGGVIVRDENKIFDASLKTQLAKLKQALM